MITGPFNDQISLNVASQSRWVLSMFYWIYDLPTPTLAAMFSAFFVGVAWIGTIFIRPILRLFVRSQQNINDIVGYLLSCYCVFYGLLLGLLAVAAYQNYADVEKTVTQEAASLAALYRDVSNYPEPARTDLQTSLRDFTHSIIHEAWPQQRKGIIPKTGDAHVTKIQTKLFAFEPVTKGQEILHAEAVGEFNSYLEHRRMRLFSVTTCIPPIMWYIVILGAFINIMFLWFFDMRLLVQLLIGGLLAFFIGAMICVIAAMDNPFRGEVSIGPDVFVDVYESLMKSSYGLSSPP